jgi:hypothetical protein
MEYDGLNALLEQMADLEDRLDSMRETVYHAIPLGDP